ncbi:Uma2 family endonuclease [Aerosakkonema sp. BLCC-F183]|uniref:Uma2 family endonuclease n=1 Tax=Aerosakkonema sp. BLCC-F183 TaxID=3342834 RepID=UPI0035BB66B5
MNVQTVNTPTIAKQKVSPGNSIVMNGIKWETYKALMADVGDGRAWRIAYDEGVLEIRMPLQEHEQPKIVLAYFVTAIADELEIETMELGALLLEREDLRRAIEPDTCFYIQNESLVRSKIIDLQTDPPPDLAIESDYTSSSLNKFTIYASLGVPELWRYRNQSLQVYQLVEGKYEQTDKSLAFPFLPIAEVPGFIEQSISIGQRSAVRLFRERIREILQNREG